MGYAIANGRKIWKRQRARTEMTVVKAIRAFQVSPWRPHGLSA
jgi:hypothetical protein